MIVWLESCYRRSRFFRWAPIRRAAKLPVLFGLWLLERMQRFKTSPWDSIPYRFRYLLSSDELETIDILSKVCQAGQVALDIGANVGYFSRMLTKLLGPDGRIFSLEPNPDVFAILQENARYWLNVSTHNIALGRASGFLTLVVPENASVLGFVGHSGERINARSGDVFKEFPVVVKTGDDFLSEQNLTHIDFMKVDVEGGECDVLDGLRATLHNSEKVFIIIELNPPSLQRFGKDSFELFNILWDLEFLTYECGKYTDREIIANITDVSGLENKMNGGCTNIVGFKGYSEVELLRALAH